MVALLLFLVVLLLPAQAALAGHVECGSVITEDTTLDSDVVCEGETYGVTAITIAADDVTLDLAGHVVRGAPAYSPPSNAIGTDGLRARLRIHGGTVRGVGVGIDLRASDSDIERVTSLGNGGVGFDVRGDNNVVRRSQVDHSAEDGISVRGDGAVLERNRVRGMTACLLVYGEAPRVRSNRLGDCYTAGGIQRYTTATVERNTVTGNASGFYVHGEGAVIRRNDFSGNEVSGLTVVDPRARIDRNVASDNALDTDSTPQGGIEVFSPGALLSHNRADRNAEYGIYAVPGVVDGGGNRARDNGNPLQCANVVCRK